MARKRYTKPGDLMQLRRVLWQEILDVRALTGGDAPAPELVLRSAHALSQLGAVYLKLTEAADLEKRIQALEAHTCH
jgi:hypothetical protein